MNMLIQVELIQEAVLGVSAFTYRLGVHPTAFPDLTVLVEQSSSNQNSKNSKTFKRISDLNDLLILNSAAVETPLFSFLGNVHLD